MLRFKALYKAMYDDLKDSNMFIDWALELKRTEDKNDLTVAKTLAEYATERFSHFNKFHQFFVTQAKTMEEKMDKDAVEFCLWDVSHQHMQDWAAEIKSKLDSF